MAQVFEVFISFCELIHLLFPVEEEREENAAGGLKRSCHLERIKSGTFHHDKYCLLGTFVNVI